MSTGMLFQICESCRSKVATHLVYFYDDGPTFAVCDPCATASTGFYGRVVSMDSDQPPSGGDAA